MNDTEALAHDVMRIVPCVVGQAECVAELVGDRAEAVFNKEMARGVRLVGAHGRPSRDGRCIEKQLTLRLHRQGAKLVTKNPTGENSDASGFRKAGGRRDRPLPLHLGRPFAERFGKKQHEMFLGQAELGRNIVDQSLPMFQRTLPSRISFVVGNAVIICGRLVAGDYGDLGFAATHPDRQVLDPVSVPATALLVQFIHEMEQDADLLLVIANGPAITGTK